jgi:hypothetical protein
MATQGDGDECEDAVLAMIQPRCGIETDGELSRSSGERDFDVCPRQMGVQRGRWPGRSKIGDGRPSEPACPGSAGPAWSLARSRRNRRQALGAGRPMGHRLPSWALVPSHAANTPRLGRDQAGFTAFSEPATRLTRLTVAIVADGMRCCVGVFDCKR